MISEISREHRYDENIYEGIGENPTFEMRSEFRKLKFDPEAKKKVPSSTENTAMSDMFKSFEKSKERRRTKRKELVSEQTKVLAGHYKRDDVRLNRARRREEEARYMG